MKSPSIRPSHLRSAIVDSMRSRTPPLDPNFSVLLEEQKYNAVDIACAVLQGPIQIDFSEIIQKNNLIFREMLESEILSTTSRLQILKYQEVLNDLISLAMELNNSEYRHTPTDEYKSSKPTPYYHLTQPVFTAYGKLEGESIRLFLESFGIPSAIYQESAGVVLGLTVGALGQAEIRVMPEDAEDAEMLLTAMKEGLFEFPAELEDITDDMSLQEDEDSNFL